MFTNWPKLSSIDWQAAYVFQISTISRPSVVRRTFPDTIPSRISQRTYSQCRSLGGSTAPFFDVQRPVSRDWLLRAHENEVFIVKIWPCSPYIFRWLQPHLQQKYRYFRNKKILKLSIIIFYTCSSVIFVNEIKC